MRHPFFFVIFLALSFIVKSQISNAYYDDTNDKYNEDLIISLHNIIKENHTQNSYSDLWYYYEITDKDSSGNVWDMYSNCNFQFYDDQCGNYSHECDCYNREHSVPQSWVGGSIQPMYADLYNVVPVEAWTNNKRSNYPFGRVGIANWTSYNGSKLGNSSVSGYSGIVFEPIDEYKGDFARIMFYMAIRYQNLVSSWCDNSTNADAVFDCDNWKLFEQWALDLYLQWHQDDPVSPKEISRNDSVYLIQHNRNPFVDNPNFANDIWLYEVSVNESFIISTIDYSFIDNMLLINSNNIIKNVSIYDVFGRLISNNILNQNNSNINLNSVENAIYIVKCNLLNNENKTFKILKY